MLETLFVLAESEPRAALFIYASRSATRCSSDGEADAELAVCARSAPALIKNALNIEKESSAGRWGDQNALGDRVPPCRSAESLSALEFNKTGAVSEMRR